MSDSKRSSRAWAWLATLLLLAGAGLRLWFIGVHGLDADELFTLNFLRAPLSLILSTFFNTVIEVDAKLYYLVGQPWVLLVGATPLALRLPNVLADALLGALLVFAARSHFGARAALIVGVLWATNPLLIWVAGMVRMYSILGLLAGLAWIAAIRAANTNSRRWWLVFVIAALAAGYVHVLGVIVIGAAGVIIVALAVIRRRIEGLIALAVVGAGYLPYGLNLWSELSTARRLGADVPADPYDFIARFFSALTVNQTSLPIVVAGAALLTVGIGWWRSPKPRVWMTTLIAMFLVFAAASGYLALRQSIFESRYVAYGVPLYVLLAGVSISRLPSRWLQVGLLVTLIGLGAHGVNVQSQPLARDDFGSAARFLETHADTGDLIITMGDFALPPMDYAYQGETTILAPWHDVLGGGFQRQLGETLAGYDTAWIVLYQTNVVDPEGRFDRYFRNHNFPIRAEVFPTGLTVRGYDLRPMTDALPPDAAPASATFNGQLALRGYQTYAPALSARDNRLHPPSGWAHVTLYWEALQPGLDFAPSVQLEDSVGQVWGINLTRGGDVFSLYPPATWQPGQIWRSDFDVNLNPATPSGEYSLVLRVAAPGSDQFWADESGEMAVLITTVMIIP